MTRSPGFQPARGTLRWRMHFRSAPERVYSALATDAGRSAFWAESTREEGDVLTFSFVGNLEVEGRILAREPPSRFVLEYFGAVVEFSLAADGGGGTDLSLFATGVADAEYWEVVAGWVSVLMAMKAAVDHGVDLRNHDPGRAWSSGYADN